MSAPLGAVPATACQVARMIADAVGTRFRVVGSLPVEGEPNIVYLVPRAEPGGGNAHDEYVFVSDAWEKIGSTDIDLSGYVEKEEGKGLFSGSYDDLTGKPTIPAPVTIDSALSDTSENPVQNKAVKAALDGKVSRAEAEVGFTEWVVERDGVDVTSQIAMPPHYEGVDTWIVEDSLVAGDELPANPGLSALPDAVELSWESGDGVHAYTAARAKLRPTKTSDLANDSGFLTEHQQLTPVYSQTPTFSEWVVPQGYNQPIYNDGVWAIDDGFREFTARGTFYSVYLEFSDGVEVVFTATRVRTDIIGYTLGGQTAKPLQPQGDYAVKSEMSVTPGTGDVTIQLKSGMSATVLTDHQSWGDVKPSGGIPKTDLASAVQASLGKADTALQSHQSLAGLMPKYAFSAVQTISSAGTEQSPNEVALANAQNKRVSVTASGAYISVAALATASDGIIRDMMLTLDCSMLSEGDEPHVTFASVYKGADDDANNLVADAGAVNVYYVTEYAPNAFLVAKQAIGAGS